MSLPIDLALPMAWLAAVKPGAAEDLVELLARAAAGEADSLARLYDATARELWGLALCRGNDRDLAADAVQEVFCRLASGRGPRGRVRNARAWLLACVRRAAIDAHRRRRREVAFDAACELFVPGDPERAADARRAADALARLKPRLREAVYLRFAVELSFAEIGRVVGVPTFTAASRVRLGLARLRKLLGEGP